MATNCCLDSFYTLDNGQRLVIKFVLLPCPFYFRYTVVQDFATFYVAQSAAQNNVSVF